MTRVQMDRFIPNRSASNLDSSQYNIALEMRDVENTQQNVASSPSKVCPCVCLSQYCVTCVTHVPFVYAGV